MRHPHCTPNAERLDPTMSDSRYRFLYNCDANNWLIHDPPVMTPEDAHKYVDEVAETPVTTFLMSCHAGMDFTFPGKACPLAGSRLSEAEWEALRDPEKCKPGTDGYGLPNLHGLVEAGHDPFGLMLDRSRERGLETFITWRPAEVHCVEQPDSYLISQFWLDHPEWHVGQPGDPLPDLHTEILGPVSPIVATWIPGGLDWAVPEVREQSLAQISEACERYPEIDGFELDFQRFPIYFRFGEEEAGIPFMTDFVRKVREITKRVGDGRGRPMLFSVRSMARPAQNRALGLDLFAWAAEGLFDFVMVSHYLRNEYPLPLAQYRPLLPANMPMYASIEYEGEADRYREIGRELWRDGADGVSMFNFFAAREGSRQPPFDVLHEIGDREKMLAAED